MNKLRLTLEIIGCLFLGMVFVIIVLAMLNTGKEPHWTEKEIPDQTERPFSVNVTSIKEGLPVATAEVQKWEKNIVLTGINVSLAGKEAVKSRKGGVSYRYHVVNSDSRGYAVVRCYVVLDMQKQAITSMYVRSDPRERTTRNGYVPEELTTYLDIDEILDVLESSKAFTYYDDFSVIISINRGTSSIIVNGELGVGEGFYINNSTKQLVSSGKFFIPTPE
ncbi:hypothetical protein LJC10_06320 [Selenomonadales bacterium OttesenSCG-928-I06]|nr:hypothetical protein [Selenomonadales bacterium OttesenSCG-928-I06]